MNPIFAYYYSNGYIVYRTNAKYKDLACYLSHNQYLYTVGEYRLRQPFTFYSI